MRPPQIRLKRLLCFPLALLALLMTHLAASQKVKFSKVLPPSGNFSGIVGGITQDKNGYLWIATTGGLYKYDGYRFRLYTNDPADPTSIVSSRLETVCADRKGNIWIATWAEGLERLDPVTGVFTHFRHNPNERGSLSSDTIRSILEDRDGTLWLGTTSGMDRYDPETNTFQNYRHRPDKPNSLSCNRVRKIYQDKEGTIWVGTGSVWVNEGGGTNEGGLNRFDKKTGTFTRYLHDPHNPHSLLNNKVQGILEDSRGTFWVGTAGDGLHTFDRHTGKFQRHRYNPLHPEGLSRPRIKDASTFDHITSLTEDAVGNIWIGTLESGIARYSPKTGKTTHYDNKDTAVGFTDNSGWTFYNSADGIFWVGTWQGGLFRMDPYHQDIPHVTIGSNVGAFLQEPDGRFWIGSGNGLILRDAGRGVFKRFEHRNNDLTSLSNNAIRSLLRDKAGTIWVGTSNGLNRFNRGNNSFTRYTNNPDDPNSISIGEIYAMEEAGDDSLWVGTDNGLDRLDKRTGNCTHFWNNPNDANSLTRSDIGPLLKDASGNLWVGTWPGNGLDYLNPGSGVVKHFFKGIRILSLCRDAAGTLWVGTDGVGIYQSNKAMDGFTKITAPASGLEKSPVLSIQEDNEANIWLRTESEIYRINPKTGQITVFGTNYGVNTGNLNYNAGYKGRNGEIYFGDVNGYYVFSPAALLTNPVAPKVVLTDLRIGGKSVAPGKDGSLYTVMEQATEMDLQHNQNAFVIEFAAIHFGNPAQNRHLYKLENYDAEWREAGLEKSASYYNVPPGRYVFRVRAASGEGVWAEKAISVVVHPPWWRTWWAYAGYLGLLVIAFWSILRFSVNRAKLRAQLNFEQLEAQRIKELDTAKTQLYTNITHEFRTPLTVILGTAQELLNNPGGNIANGMNMIIRNGNSLLVLVNEMLDLAKLESGKMLLQPVNGDIIHFLRYITESFQSLAEKDGKRLHFLTELNSLPVAYDPEKLRQIISNLLSNAVRFTPEKGAIYFSVSKETVADKKEIVSLVLKIKDTGMGIPEEELPYIFDRFYQLDTGHTRKNDGTGIGLALTKELVKLMKGEITVKSPPSGANKGSEFTVVLPLIQVVLNEEDALSHPIKTKSQPPANILPASVPLLPEEKNNNDKPLILLVEDNADVAAYTASCLTGYRLLVGKDGREGWAIALASIPDLIISDVMMPFLDGFELCQRLRSDERTSHIPIILLTAKADMESKLEGLQRGADAYLEKPFHREELLVRIKKTLELRKNLQQYYLNKSGLQNDKLAAAPEPVPALADNKAEDAFVKKVTDAIEKNIPDSGFTVEHLCKLVFMSHSQLHRKLEALTGCSPSLLIRMHRMSKAKELLKNTDNSIGSVSLDCGYNDPAYFSRVFKQTYSLTPQEWRMKEKTTA